MKNKDFSLASQSDHQSKEGSPNELSEDKPRISTSYRCDGTHDLTTETYVAIAVYLCKLKMVG